MNWADIEISGVERAADAPPPGIVVNAPSRADLLADVAQRMQAGRGYTIATLNLDHVVKIRRDPEFRQAYARHSHVTADGNPIVWLSRLAGQQLELMPGSELIDPLAALAAEHDVPVGFLGSTQEVLEAAAIALRRKHPGLRITARIAPPMGFDPRGAGAGDCIAELRAAGVGLCFLALGAPKQEIFAAHAAPQMPQTGFVSIGAGLDFIAGHQSRAPRWVRRLAMEWLWRLLSHPGRLGRRYGACIAILPRLLAEAFRSRAADKTGHPLP